MPNARAKVPQLVTSVSDHTGRVNDLPVLENPGAPMIYFDLAPVFGNVGGVCSVTLEAAVHTLRSDGIEARRIAVAHLRMGISAATSLRDALNSALMVGAPSPEKMN